MPEKSTAHRLLALFTSPEHADSIEGDLLEQRQAYGRLWFAVNVVTTAFALWKQAVELAFLRTAALTALAVALSFVVCGLVAFVRIELAAFGLPNVPALLLIAACAFVLGAGLVRVAPATGAPAALAASLVLLLLFLHSQIDVRVEQVQDAAGGNIVVAAASALVSFIRDLTAAALIYLLPLNLGSVLMHGRRARR